MGEIHDEEVGEMGAILIIAVVVALALLPVSERVNARRMGLAPMASRPLAGCGVVVCVLFLVVCVLFLAMSGGG